MLPSQARGLSHFIADIRNSATKEDESKRVDKELANVRQKFTASDKLNSYHKKKYVWKLVYIFMLGYDVDFGHIEAVQLMQSPKYSEKVVGYAAVALLVRPGDEVMDLVIRSIKNDLVRPDNAAQSLALACIANLGFAQQMIQLAPDVQALLVKMESHVCVKKKAALCLLRLFRTDNKCVVHHEWVSRIDELLKFHHLGVLTSAMSLLLGLASRSPSHYPELILYVIHILRKLVTPENRDSAPPHDYLYYNTPAPWLLIKLLKFLQYYPIPADATQRGVLKSVIKTIFDRTRRADSANKNNADHGVLFETINLVIHHGLDGDADLRQSALSLLGKFISMREPNMRYIGLQTMARMARVEGNEHIKKHQQTVLSSLQENDISVRRRALDLLFVMTDRENSKLIVEELMKNLVDAEPDIREEMVLKIAILAEKYAADLEWYVEKILDLITIAGDFVSDDIWHRLIQIVTNNKELQEYAATKLFQKLQVPRAHETLVRVGSYIIGEFGFLIGEEAGQSGEEQFALLHRHFLQHSRETKIQMLSSFVKLANLFEEVRPLVAPIFAKYRSSGEVELAQRALEYSVLPSLGDELLEDVLREMPQYSTDRQSVLEKRLTEKDHATHDGNAWVMKKGEADSGAGDKGRLEQPDKASAQQPDKGLQQATNLLDIDDTQQQQQPPAAQTPPPTTATNTTTGDVITITPEDHGSMKSWFNALVIGQQGTLYENAHIQVGVRHAYQNYQARLALYLRNKTSAPLTNVAVELPKEAYLVLNMMNGMPDSVPPQGTGQLQLTGECMLPFDVAPECTISFNGANGQPFRFPLRLPMVATCFMEPLQLGAQDFGTKWGAIPTSNDREQQEVFDSSTPITPEFVERIKTVILGTGLHLGVVQDVPQPPNGMVIICAASTFRTGTVAPNAAPGANPPPRVSVGCLVKVEANPTASAFRLTVRAVHGTVSVALRNVIKAQLRNTVAAMASLS